MKKSKKTTVLSRTFLGCITAFLLLLDLLSGITPPNQSQQADPQPEIELCSVTKTPSPTDDLIDID